MVLRSPLYELQKSQGASFTEFAGYEMPLQYSSITDEHLTVRKTVGLFDVSHMSNVWITGPDAEQLLSRCTVEDASRIGDGKSQYTEILREDGTVIDDTIFMHLDDRFMLVPNAGMDHIVTEWFNKQAAAFSLNARAENVSREFVILAVQGPQSQKTLQMLTTTDLSEIGFFGCRSLKVADVSCIVSHTGYTGELGFELQITPPDKARHVFEQILQAGSSFDIKPIGLGARDTLRLEKSFILAGHEFKGGRTPLEAALSWTINWDHEFIGKQALLKQKEKGGYQRLTNIICTDKGIPRAGCSIQKEGTPIGEVTSGTLSPCLKTGIAMGYVHPDYRNKGDTVEIVVRGKVVTAEVVKPPIVPKDWLKQQGGNV